MAYGQNAHSCDPLMHCLIIFDLFDLQSHNVPYVLYFAFRDKPRFIAITHGGGERELFREVADSHT